MTDPRTAFGNRVTNSPTGFQGSRGAIAYTVKLKRKGKTHIGFCLTLINGLNLRLIKTVSQQHINAILISYLILANSS